jgi:NCS1 family nucleobase:cation symporter-1
VLLVRRADRGRVRRCCRAADANDSFLQFHQSSHLLGHSTLEVICFLVIWALQLLIIQNGMETVRRFQDFSGPAVWVMMLILAIWLNVKAGGFSFSHDIPDDVILSKTADAGVIGLPGSFTALAAAAATWVTYFAALYLNFCDFSRFAKDKATVRKGNLWGLPVNLILFSLVAGLTTVAAFRVYNEVLLHPEQISAKFDSWFLALLAAVTFAVATLGINVVANFVSPAFDFSNVFPSKISFKRGGVIAALIALVLYPFAPWEGDVAGFVNAVGATMGPLLGVILVDYYLIARQRVDVPSCTSSTAPTASSAAGTSTPSWPPRSARCFPACCRTSDPSCPPGGASTVGSSASPSAAWSTLGWSVCGHGAAFAVPSRSRSLWRADPHTSA